MADTHQHHHSHSHAPHSGHSHHHHHSHGAVLGNMKWAFFLNLSFSIIELVGGLWTNSVAIMSDALHDFGDALAMALAIGLEKFSHRKSDGHFSYGYRRFSTLGAVITGVILIVGSILILIEAVPRLVNPTQPHANGMIALAVLGLAVNGFAAYKVSRGESLNEKMLMWHMVEDVLGWAMVLVGALVMKFFEVPQLDAAMAIALALWIMYNVFRNLRQAVDVFLMAAPANASVADVVSMVTQVSGVEAVHHGHLWSLDGQNHIFTGHIVVAKDSTAEQISKIKSEIKKKVKELGIIEATLETELFGAECADPEHDTEHEH